MRRKEEEKEEEEEKDGSFLPSIWSSRIEGGGIDAGINIRDKFFAVTHPLPLLHRCHVIKRLRRHRRCDGNRVEP